MPLRRRPIPTPASVPLDGDEASIIPRPCTNSPVIATRAWLQAPRGGGGGRKLPSGSGKDVRLERSRFQMSQRDRNLLRVNEPLQIIATFLDTTNQESMAAGDEGRPSHEVHSDQASVSRGGGGGGGLAEAGGPSSSAGVGAAAAAASGGGVGGGNGASGADLPEGGADSSGRSPNPSADNPKGSGNSTSTANNCNGNANSSSGNPNGANNPNNVDNDNDANHLSSVQGGTNGNHSHNNSNSNSNCSSKQNDVNCPSAGSGGSGGSHQVLQRSGTVALSTHGSGGAISHPLSGGVGGTGSGGSCANKKHSGNNNSSSSSNNNNNNNNGSNGIGNNKFLNLTDPTLRGASRRNRASLVGKSALLHSYSPALQGHTSSSYYGPSIRDASKVELTSAERKQQIMLAVNRDAYQKVKEVERKVLTSEQMSLQAPSKGLAASATGPAAGQQEGGGSTSSSTGGENNNGNNNSSSSNWGTDADGGVDAEGRTEVGGTAAASSMNADSNRTVAIEGEE